MRRALECALLAAAILCVVSSCAILDADSEHDGIARGGTAGDGGTPALGGANQASSGEGNAGTSGGPKGGGANQARGGGVNAGTSGGPKGGGANQASGRGGNGATSERSTGGTGGSLVTEGGAGGAGADDCTFSLSSELSPVIGTVGIVEWSSGLRDIREAAIEFGLDGGYGMLAPVDLAEPNYRTLLLGMKPSRTYHFRVVARSSSSACASDDYTLTTGPLPSNLQQISVNTFYPERLAGGFLLTGQYVTPVGTQPPAYILDQDGEIVWWYWADTSVTGVSMSYDGKWVWINAANPPELPTSVRRVSMDGLIDENLSEEFEGQNHQLAVLPDESVAFYARRESGCDDVKLRHPDGTVQTLMNTGDVPQGGDCHINMIAYSPFDDTLVYSDLYHLSYTKITRDGTIVWILGGGVSDFTGDGAIWENQHGVHVLGLDRLLIFNNGPPGGESLALEILLDLGERTATRVWSYGATPPLYSGVMGDVQRLANGNTMVAYSAQGVIHEVDPDGTLVRELRWVPNGTFGYVRHRDSLYGPPDR